MHCCCWVMQAICDDEEAERPGTPSLEVNSQSGDEVFETLTSSKVPSKRSVNKKRHQVSDLDSLTTVAKSATQMLQDIATSSKVEAKAASTDTDMNFCMFLYGIMRDIPSGYNKDCLYSEMQQLVLSARMQSSENVETASGVSSYGYALYQNL